MLELAVKRQPILRLAAGAATLLAEYALLGVTFDGSRLTNVRGWWAHLGNVGNVVSIGALVLTMGVLTRWQKLADAVRDSDLELGPMRWHWLLLHALSFAGFVALSALIFNGSLDDTSALATTIVWLLVGLASVFFLFRLWAGQAWWSCARELLLVVRAGAVLGPFAWWAAWNARPFWPWLLAKTLPVAAALLRVVAPHAEVDTSTSILRLESFAAKVAPECSGVEGLVVVTAVLIGYLLVSRRDFRFPNALLLIPIGLATVWLLNATRIAALVLIGARLSPQVALGGFHSKAGWLGVCVVALALVALSRRSRFFMKRVDASARSENPAVAYCMPLFVMTAIALLTALGSAGIDWLYPVRVLGAAIALWYYRDKFASFGRIDSYLPFLNGAVVFVLWFALLRFEARGEASGMPEQLAAAPPLARAGWIAARVLGSVVATPIVEELAFRGFLQRRLIEPEFTEVDQRRFTWLSLALSAVAFGGVHSSWLAGSMAGAAYSFATYRRGRLGDAIVAHATSNALIAVAVLGFGQWFLW